jgi:outer membrane PBP1 activator LpoA protein
MARGGVAAAAAFLERAAELSPDPASRGTRALAAARLKLDAGAAEAAERLVAVATTSQLEELDRARAERLRALIAYSRTRASDAPSLLSTAAKRLEALDPSWRARHTWARSSPWSDGAALRSTQASSKRPRRRRFPPGRSRRARSTCFLKPSSRD